MDCKLGSQWGYGWKDLEGSINHLFVAQAASHFCNLEGNDAVDTNYVCIMTESDEAWTDTQADWCSLVDISLAFTPKCVGGAEHWWRILVWLNHVCNLSPGSLCRAAVLDAFVPPVHQEVLWTQAAPENNWSSPPRWAETFSSPCLSLSSSTWCLNNTARFVEERFPISSVANTCSDNLR